MSLFYGAPVDSQPERDAGLDIIPTSAGMVHGATWSGTLHDNLTIAAERSGELTMRNAGLFVDPFGNAITLPGRENIPMLSPEDANKKYKLPGMTPWTRPVADDVAQDIFEAHRQRLIRENVIERNGDTFSGGMVPRFLTMAAASLLDPANVAAAFIPVVPEAKVAAWLAGQAGPLGRAGVRAGVGAIEGGVGMAVLEPFAYARDMAEHNDWTMGGAAMNVALGSVMGGALHPVVGRFSRQEREFGMPRISPEANEAGTREGLAALLQDRPTVAAQVIEAVEAGKARQDLAQAARMGDAADASLVAGRAPGLADVRLREDLRAPESLMQFLATKGGIQEQGGDLAAIGADAFFVPGGGRVVRKTGMTLDYAREAAEEAGFIKPNSTIADFLDAVAEEVAGRRVYRGEDIEIARQRAELRHVQYDGDVVNAHRADVGDIAEAYGVQLSRTEVNTAIQGILNGDHPEQAVRDAIMAREIADYPGMAREGMNRLGQMQRDAEGMAIDGASAPNPRVTVADAELARLAEAAPKTDGPLADQIAAAQKDITNLDVIVNAERKAERLDANAERLLKEADERAALAESDAKAMEAAGFCMAVRG